MYLKDEYIGGALSNLTKKELLRRIRKYEKTSGNKSRISMRHKKQVMLDYLQQNVPQRKVIFIEKPKVIEIEGRTDKGRISRKKALRKINKGKKDNKGIRNIYYKNIPSLEKYLEIKKYNLNLKGKQLKKKEPLKFIKGIDSEDKKKHYIIKKNGKNIKLNIILKKRKIKLS
jgi:hypothetical protein